MVKIRGGYTWLVCVFALALAVSMYDARAAEDSVKVSTTVAASSHPNISGHWKLNKEQGDSKTGSGEHQWGSGDRGGGMGRGMSGGGWGGHRGMSGPGGSGRPGGMGRGGLDELNILQSDSTVTITDKNGRDRVLYTDGRLVHVAADSGMTMDMRAYWNGDAELVVEHINPERGSMKELYSVSTDGSKLTVVMQNPLGVEHSRVYAKEH